MEPDLNIEISNCFRIGYKDAGDALCAVRKSGVVLGRSWMVGVKWAVCFFILVDKHVLMALTWCRILLKWKSSLDSYTLIMEMGPLALSISHSLSADPLQPMSVDPQSNPPLLPTPQLEPQA